jgi:hypothetical protein
LVGSLGDISTVWAAFPASSVPRVVTLIHTASLADLERAGVLSIAVTEPAIAAAIDARLAGMTADELERAVIQRPAAHHVDHALTALADAGSFRTAESRLRIILPLEYVIQVLHLERIIEILRTDNQVSQAKGMPYLLKQLFDATAGRPGAVAVW